LPDRGAKNAVPSEDWTKIEEGFQSIFSQPNISEALLQQLANCKDIFNQFIPPIENDINELPDNLDVEL
jgi:putative membrane protein